MSHPYDGKHFALLVESIDETIAYMTSTLGVAFGPLATIPFVMKGGREEFEQEARVCYAADGHVELVEAVERGPFSRSQGLGMHHFGGVVGDLDAAIEDQRTHGNDVDWEVSYGGQLIAVFFKGNGSLPGRLEFVTRNPPPLFEQYAN